MALCLLPSCAVQMICPAYQSAFVLDESQQEDLYSLFTVVDGDTVPKRPYGFRFKAEGDSMMEKFIKGTSGKGFRVQRGRVHSFEKSGFTYDNRVKEKLWARVFNGKEKPVLENPYLFDRIFKKRPYHKLDELEMDIVHFNRTRYDSLLRVRINHSDTTRYDSLMAEMSKYPPAIQVQYAPLLKGFNEEQEQYNKRFGKYFLQFKEAEATDPELADTTSLQDFQADTLATDTTSKKKKGLGLFRKKNKPPKPKKDRKKKGKKNNSEGVLNEEDN